MPSISVVICCANVADTLAAACRSARAVADEIVVVDSGSEDDTGAIGREHADRYEQEPWRGYDRQKQYGASLAVHDWVFILDGDEEISPELAAEIKDLDESVFESADVMTMPRLNYVMNRPVTAWLPDTQDRLIHRERVTWPEEALHERREPSDPSRVKSLLHPILHKRKSAAGFEDYFSGRRMDERLLPVARQMYERGRRCRVWDLWLRPKFAFLKFYLLKGGILDGSFGLLIAQKAAVSTQLKYAALWAVQRGEADRDSSIG
ncbi:MAG: glycosyltransferase family 2 protein [Phycisphaeraceae bacterium]|nr:glycosyltransferase family 2 protein [Phycisphaeraceae bacterium]